MRHARTLWEEGDEPGPRVVVLALAVALTATALDLAATGRLGTLFDPCFVVLSVAVALLVHPRDLFTAGVLPPLLMLLVVALLAATSPGAVASADDGWVQAVVTGLSHHSLALGVGYGLCLAALALRRRVLRLRQDGGSVRLTRSG